MKALHYAKQIAYSSWDVLLFSYECAKKAQHHPGCIVECGIAAGGNLIALMYGAPDKAIFAFDSFCGLPLPSNRDDQMPGIRMLKDWERKALPDPGKQALETTGAVSVSIADVMDNIKKAGLDPFANLYLVEGWFEDTVPKFNYLDGIALLRLDGDLFHSTWVCLQHLFPKVIQGGCVIIDDWTLQGCQDACKEYFELIGYEPQYQYLDGTAYFFK